jgi:PAS domain S-box-containing protein
MSLVMLALSVWLASANLDSVRATDTLSEQTHRAQSARQEVLAALTDAETGQRGYLLTGAASYLAPYAIARPRLAAAFAQLRSEPQMVGDQARRLDAVEALATAKMAELARTIALAKAGQGEAALDLVRSGRGRGLMDALRVQLAALRPASGELQQDRMWARSAWPRIAVVGLGLLSSILLAGVGLGQNRARRAASASLASLRRFTRAFGLTQGLLRTPGGIITFWARGMERLYGYTSREAVGHRRHELLKTRYSTPPAEIQAALDTEGHWEGEMINRHRDGSTLEVATQLTLHQDAKGDADAGIELDSDVSEMRRVQRANDQASALLRAVVEAAPGRIYAKDREGRMLLANGHALALIGKGWAEVEGRTDLDLMANRAQAETVMANDRRVMTAGRDEELEEVIGDEGGADRVWLSTKTPLRDPAGEVCGLVGVSVDITDIKRRAMELAAVNADLSVALANGVAALKERDVLLREVYHRVKNNLQIIDGFIVMQARQLADPAARAALLGLRNRLQSLALVHHQLMHSKNLRTFDISPFLQELTGNLLEGAAADGVRLSIHAVPLDVDLDFAIPLGLLVAELVTNSLKHAFPLGKGTIAVSLERAPDGDLALVVSDDGQGRRANGAPGAARPGLGETIIKGLVEQLGGTQISGGAQGARTEIRVAAPVMT